ncbi:protein POOR HOMOLOGOUS SYNAPSIS 1-like isoform X2 [Tripterygium wilfordii]|uniref:protein POOR HOMOLOGOUS SYNAPSIS 1-like isoform X2 n=1 Tax=Tripterygium wilfordii TaxID=458696 RepID=UPI0018F829F0|nr:protein POOR HOMOLOGOUS SYNAPSIS 1-like isoform X2 [Tripterygium wilfordii]
MAGSLVAIRDQWQVAFSRFFTFPSLTSTSSSLVPLPKNRRDTKGIKGTWISTSSPTVSLQLLNSHSKSDVILNVSLRETVLEEHYVSKLHFSWPQVTCVPGYPSRGTRAVFVSYKDSVGEIQKFALRFSTVQEVESFMNGLREILKDVQEIEPLSSNFRSVISSQSEFVPSNKTSSRACQEELSIMNSLTTYSPQMQESLNHEVEQCSYKQETALNHNAADTMSALPPSFASFLTNCYPEINQPNPIESEEVDLKSQIVKYMEESSFQEMLMKVEKVISEMGDDLMPEWP